MNMGIVLPLIVVGAIAIALAVTSILFTRHVGRFRQEAEALRTDAVRLQQAVQVAEDAERIANQRAQTLAHYEQERDSALAQVNDLHRQLSEQKGFVEQAEHDIEFYQAELEKRPKVVRKTYKILTLGVSGTGKTALTLKWANPLTDLGALQGTKIERYERTVSHVPGKEQTIEHVFEVGDWGGEHIVDAQQELVMEEIHGLLMVVDLAQKDSKAVEPGRVQSQLREFQPESLKFFFGPKTIASCKTVVLFINKADLISGTPADVEREARTLYKRLIDDLERFKSQLDVRVLVGSATYGHSTHHLFSHFVERILPKNAYDPQLLQRMKSDAMASDLAAGSYAAPLQQTQPFPPTPGGQGPNGQPVNGAPNVYSATPPQRPPAYPPNAAPTAAPARPAGAVPNLAAIRRPDAKR
ncbi:MAG: hypothetical protein U0441_12165 [Polyangiaceae bacterium]